MPVIATAATAVATAAAAITVADVALAAVVLGTTLGVVGTITGNKDLAMAGSALGLLGGGVSMFASPEFLASSVLGGSTGAEATAAEMAPTLAGAAGTEEAAAATQAATGLGPTVGSTTIQGAGVEAGIPNALGESTAGLNAQNPVAWNPEAEGLNAWGQPHTPEFTASQTAPTIDAAPQATPSGPSGGSLMASAGNTDLSSVPSGTGNDWMLHDPAVQGLKGAQTSPEVQGWWGKLSDTTKAHIALTGGQVVSGLISGIGSGMSQSAQLELQKQIFDWKKQQTQSEFSRAQSSPGIIQFAGQK